MIIRGQASDTKETFAFTIEPHVAGGYILYIAFSGDGRDGMTGAGIWPSTEKAQEVAQATAAKLLHGAIIDWEDSN